MKQILYLFEFFFVFIIFIFFKLLPINLVSFIGGKSFQILGPFSKSHQTAISNFKKVFPDWNEKKIRFNLSKSWNNLGKTLSNLQF